MVTWTAFAILAMFYIDKDVDNNYDNVDNGDNDLLLILVCIPLKIDDDNVDFNDNNVVNHYRYPPLILVCLLLKVYSGVFFSSEYKMQNPPSINTKSFLDVFKLTTRLRLGSFRFFFLKHPIEQDGCGRNDALLDYIMYKMKEKI